MGLDVSHGCWRGAYSAFHTWRSKLAEVAGFPPLELMDGFYVSPQSAFLEVSPYWKGKEQSHPVLSRLPIPWKLFNKDPLSILLMHSDCDGSLPWQDCHRLARRLDRLVPLLPDEDAGGHIRNWRQTTRRFASGLRAAAKQREDVTFG